MIQKYDIQKVLAVPTITPEGGTFNYEKKVTIASPGVAAIVYTLDGTDPKDLGKGAKLISGDSEEITITSSCTLKARTSDASMDHFSEGLATADFSINLPQPVIRLSAESTQEQPITVTIKAEGASHIYYSTDGTDPTETSNSVVYGRAADIHAALKYDIQTERDFSYKGLNTDEIISHVVDFVTLLWQNHPFREGNTRTTAVFVIKYLRSCGFKVNNELFADNSWYFRNALVRANYRNPQKGIQPDTSFLVKFFRNLLLGEDNELKNRYMLIGYKDNGNDTHTSTHTSSRTSSNDIQPSSDNVRRLILAIGKEEMSVKGMMEAVGLKNRPNFLDYSLTPAIIEGFVCRKYPDNPHHPRQRYLLTLKGLMLLDDNNS